MQGMRNPFPALALRGSIFLLALCCQFPELSAADTVLLRSGELFTGKILRLSKSEVSIQLDSGGILTFRSNRVSRVRRWIPDRSAPQITTFLEGKEVDPNEGPGRISTPDGHPEVPEERGEGRGDPEEGDSGSRTSQPPFRFAGITPIVLPSADLQRGWSLRPPPGFQEWAPGESFTEVIRAWKDRSARSTITLVAHRFGDSPEKLKKAISDNLQKAPRFRVIRDQPFQKGGAGGYRGWLLELERQHGGIDLRQILLLAERDDSIYVLCFTTPVTEYPLLARPIEDSLESLEVLKSSLNPAANPPAVPASAPTPAPTPGSTSTAGPAGAGELERR